MRLDERTLLMLGGLADVEELDGAVLARRRDERRLGVEGHVLHGVRVLEEGVHALAAAHVSHLDRLVVRAHNLQPPAIAAERPRVTE